MSSQNLKNYRKYYPLHHFVVYPVPLLLLAFSIYRLWININVNQEFVWIWSAISVAIILIILISYMLRQHYAVGLQDRIIINEFKLRYFTLTGIRLESLAYHFSDSQIFALRFSQDEDLEELMKQTIENDWPASKIKENVKNWKADHKRI
jgi:FlaA1/EpsC-like NDP-sugar epimerase